MGKLHASCCVDLSGNSSEYLMLSPVTFKLQTRKMCQVASANLSLTPEDAPSSSLKNLDGFLLDSETGFLTSNLCFSFIFHSNTPH